VCLNFVDVYISYIGLQVSSPKGHWSDIYVRCNDEVNMYDRCKR